MNRWLQIGAGVAVISALGIGVVGWMHTPGARPYLGKLGVKCPVAPKATASQLDQSRRRLLAKDIPETAAAAPRRPALGLELDRATLADGRHWAAARGLSCEERKRGYQYLQCTHVDSAAIGETYAAAPIDMLVLTYGSKDTLIGVQTYRRGLEGDAAARILTGSVEALAKDLGPPTSKSGEATPEFFRQRGFAAASVDYRFRDYLAILTAATVPGSGIVVTEKFYSTLL